MQSVWFVYYVINSTFQTIVFKTTLFRDINFLFKINNFNGKVQVVTELFQKLYMNNKKKCITSFSAELYNFHRF